MSVRSNHVIQLIIQKINEARVGTIIDNRSAEIEAGKQILTKLFEE
jgi:hypothetical protein